MRLIVDTNIVIASLISDSKVRKFIASSGLEFLVPDYLLTEVHRHRALILKKSDNSSADFDELLDHLLSFMTIVSSDQYMNYLDRAEKVMGSIDLQDSPFLALAMSIDNDGIWTNDKGFYEQDIVRVWSTKELLDIIEY